MEQTSSGGREAVSVLWTTKLNQQRTEQVLLSWLECQENYCCSCASQRAEAPSEGWDPFHFTLSRVLLSHLPMTSGGELAKLGNCDQN